LGFLFSRKKNFRGIYGTRTHTYTNTITKVSNDTNTIYQIPDVPDARYFHAARCPNNYTARARKKGGLPALPAEQFLV
jgi:hypothetical protein